MSDEERKNTSGAAALNDDSLNDVAGGLVLPWNLEQDTAKTTQICSAQEASLTDDKELIYPG